MPLTDADFGLLQSSLDATIDRLASLHLNITIERDFEKLCAALRAMKAPWVNPAFNPEHVDISPESFWLKVTDEDGNLVATHAQRLIETDDFHTLLEDRLWYRNGIEYLPGRERLRVTRSQTRISGLVAHAGGLAVVPQWRKRGLSLYLPFLSRSLAFRNYDISFVTAVCLKEMADSGLPSTNYGYAHVEPCLNGFLPSAQRNERDACLLYMSQAETMERFRRLPDHPQFPLQVRSEIRPEKELLRA